MTKHQILVQDIETFATITRLTVDVESGETATERIDQYFQSGAQHRWGALSLSTKMSMVNTCTSCLSLPSMAQTTTLSHKSPS